MGSPEPFVHHIGVFAFNLAASGDFSEAATERTRCVHIAFAAGDRAAVEAFHAAAVAADGSSRHAPRHWPRHRAHCAFLSDPDGNDIEAAHAAHKEES